MLGLGRSEANHATGRGATLPPLLGAAVPPSLIKEIGFIARKLDGYHATPKTYGFQSYISVPIFRKDGEFFGTLCAIDPRPARLNNPETIETFRLFADLLAFHLDAQERLASSNEALEEERHLADIRDQFIAVLGHDLRSPLAAIKATGT